MNDNINGTSSANYHDDQAISQDTLNLFESQYDYLDGDAWLQNESVAKYPTQVQFTNVTNWLDEPFTSLPKATRNALVDKFDEILSPSKSNSPSSSGSSSSTTSLNSMTFSRQRLREPQMMSTTTRRDLRRDTLLYNKSSTVTKTMIRRPNLRYQNGNGLMRPTNHLLSAMSDEHLTSETLPSAFNNGGDVCNNGGSVGSGSVHNLDFDSHSVENLCDQFNSTFDLNGLDHSDTFSDDETRGYLNGNNNLTYFEEIARRQQASLSKSSAKCLTSNIHRSQIATSNQANSYILEPGSSLTFKPKQRVINCGTITKRPKLRFGSHLAQ